jgi:hypothetical protein
MYPVFICLRHQFRPSLMNYQFLSTISNLIDDITGTGYGTCPSPGLLHLLKQTEILLDLTSLQGKKRSRNLPAVVFRSRTAITDKMGDGLPDIYVGERFWASGHNVATSPKICAPFLSSVFPPRVRGDHPLGRWIAHSGCIR